MTKSTLRHQIDAVFAAVRRYRAAPASLGLAADEIDEYVCHLIAAEKTLRWVEKHEATIRAAVSKKDKLADP